MDSPHIRPYRAIDRLTVLEIAADTAFFGRAVEHYWEDRQLFTDLLYRYYLDVEPEHALVAEIEGEVVGFVLGSSDTASYRGRWLRQVLPLVLRHLLQGRYRLGARTLQYTIACIKNLWRHGQAGANLHRYPAHLHINLRADTRGRGIGTRLIEAYLERLRRAGIPGVHLHTTDQNRVACLLYEKLGFELVEAHPTIAWQPFLDRTVESRYYALSFE